MSNEAIKFTFVVETTANDAYVITITSEYGQTWKVTRSLQVCSEFIVVTEAEYSDAEAEKPSSETTLSTESLKLSLERLSSYTSGLFWKYPTIAAFLEDTPLHSSTLASLQIRSLESKIESLKSHIVEYDRRLHSIEYKASSLVDVLRSMPQEQLQQHNLSSLNVAQQQNRIEQQQIQLQNNSASIAQSHDSYGHDNNAQEDLRSSPRWENPTNNEPEITAPPGFFRSRRGSNADDESSVSDSIPDRHAYPTSIAPLPSSANKFDLRPLPCEYLDRDRPIAWDPFEVQGAGSTWDYGGDHDHISSPNRFQFDAQQQSGTEDWSTRRGSIDLQDKYNWPVCADDEVDTIVSLLAPHDAQVSFRETVFLLVQQQIRLALGAVCFDASMLQTCSFLPSDPLKVTLVLTQGQVAYWHSTLSDRLRAIADNGPDIEFSTPFAVNNIDILDDLHRALLLKMSNVQLIHEVSGFRITFRIAEMDVEITANSRHDLCILAFLDEINIMIGRDSLFKRSLLLIRAWWTHETQNLVGSEVSHFISDTSLTVMILAVFNAYWQEIRSPLYALYYFLKTYEEYDGRTMAITIQGLVPFAGDAPNQPSLMKPAAGHLLQLEMLCRYWQLFNVHDPLNSSDVQGVAGPASSAVVAGGSSHMYAGYNNGQPINKVKMHMLFNSMTKALQRFERFSFNVVHPFTHLNLVTEKISSRRTALLTQLFQTGFSVLNLALQRARTESSTPQVRPAILANLFSIFGGPWRPDAHASSISFGLVDWRSNKYGLEANVFKSMGSLHDPLSQAIDYCSFVVESVISESAILTFCMDILTWRGPLPTGEVGKLLSEATTISNLSHKLREHFGGLKKFLERYPDVFVFSNDHPFNPHVLLRRTLSEENLALIDRGIFPVHLISKTSRQAPQKKVPAPVAAGGGGGYLSSGALAGRGGPSMSAGGPPSTYVNNDYYGAPSGYNVQGSRPPASAMLGGVHGRPTGGPMPQHAAAVGYGARGGMPLQGAGGARGASGCESAMESRSSKFNPSSDLSISFFTGERGGGNVGGRNDRGGPSLYGQGSQQQQSLGNGLHGNASEFYPESLGGGSAGFGGFNDRGSRSSAGFGSAFEDFDLGPAPSSQRGGLDSRSASFRGVSSGGGNAFDLSNSAGYSNFGPSLGGGSGGAGGFSNTGSGNAGFNNSSYSRY